MIALRYTRSPARYAASRLAGRTLPGLLASVAPVHLGHYDDPELPGPEWVRLEPLLAGICGSDLALVSGEASPYFSPIVSPPFVPGHEVVARGPDGARVVIEPVLACRVRGLHPPCRACAHGDTGLCERTAHGLLAPGLQTGFCQDTGGGWGTVLVAHRSQLHPVPDAMSDETAVLVEPLACAVHAVLRSEVQDGDTVLVCGAGTMGLLVVAALGQLAPGARIVAVAKHERQRREARRLGAHEVVAPESCARTVRFRTGSVLHTPQFGRPWLSGGVDVAFECAGSASALDTCLRTTRPRGRVVLVGLPGAAPTDLAPAWHRELDVRGAYTYGTERGGKRTFELALELAGHLDLDPLVSARYPLTRYREALDHALDAGRLGAVKVVFDVARS